ncbi:MAG TPA: bifunctional DNA-binding transcriptional regulator/O6-methylguanine-DNA methyltransferase Ada [Acidobacteriaceae bacterium]
MELLAKVNPVELDETMAWGQVVARDSAADFFYAVTTTGVFCRPSCKSRTPLRGNVRFYENAEAARAAGFRACKRCRPEEPQRPSPVAQMCAYLERHIETPVRLEQLGKLTKMSPFTAQRIFKQTMGATPAQYQRSLRATMLRSQLRDGKTDVTTAIYESGYGSSSRAYDNAPLGMTPRSFLAGGKGEEIRYATASVPSSQSVALGWVIVAATKVGICWVALGDSPEALVQGLQNELPSATIQHDPELSQWMDVVIARIRGEKTDARAGYLPLDLRGTAFQLKVWFALQEIPAGTTCSYSELAAKLGSPSATRAVARACATNRVAVLVPCHRVVGASGALSGYRWGIDRKRELLLAEGAVS